MTLELTGERTLPGIPEENYWFRRHVAAYRFAAFLLGGPRAFRRRPAFRRGALDPPNPPQTTIRPLILDVGSGEGYGTAILGHRAAVIGLELDPESIAHASGRYSAPLVRADACRLPVGSQSLDGIIAIQVLEHLHCADGFVRACREALRPGGLLLLATPNRNTFPAGENPSHVHEFTPGELTGLLEAHFADVRLLGLGHRSFLHALDRTLGEPIQHRLSRVPYPTLPRWLRAVLRTVRAWDFRIGNDVDGSLDLIGVCRRT
ncbi:MAG: class I SAM-dependent methyltransferase [Actinomycetota bacterium]